MNSKHIPFILLSAVAVVIAAATVVEKLSDTQTAIDMMYHSLWFVGLWCMVVIAGCYRMYSVRMWQRPGLLLFHIGFVIILAGALVTHLTGKSGFVSIRKQEAAQHFWQKDARDKTFTGTPLPFMICLKDFRIEYDDDGTSPKDYQSTVLLVDEDGERETVISMNNIAHIHGYRIYQTSYDQDLQGSVFTISYDPWGTWITYLGYILLVVGMITGNRQHPTPNKSPLPRRGWGRFLWLVAILLSGYMIVSLMGRPLVPVLRSPMLAIHVGVICLSYILLIVSIVNRRVLRTAVYLLTAGIFLGAVWANISWGAYWSWDPKESWALVTLIVYSLPLHQQSLPWFQSDRNYRIYSVLALMCLLMTYFGVNFLLGGMHSYLNG